MKTSGYDRANPRICECRPSGEKSRGWAPAMNFFLVAPGIFFRMMSTVMDSAKIRHAFCSLGIASHRPGNPRKEISCMGLDENFFKGGYKISAPKNKTQFQRVMDMIAPIQPPARCASRRGAAPGGDYHKGSTGGESPTATSTSSEISILVKKNVIFRPDSYL